MKIESADESIEHWGLNDARVWDVKAVSQHLMAKGVTGTDRTIMRRLQQWQLWPAELSSDALRDELGRPCHGLVEGAALERARRLRRLVLFVQLSWLPTQEACLYAQDARGARCWLPMGKPEPGGLSQLRLVSALQQVQQHLGKPVVVFGHGEKVGSMRYAQPPKDVEWSMSCYVPRLVVPKSRVRQKFTTPHLKRLEAESIEIIREAVAEAEKPVMLYSVGKDSSVMLHLARKAFFPGTPPFPLLHVDTRWKFQEMYLFRDHMAKISGMHLLVHINPQAIVQDINPFDHGSAIHTE